MEGKQVADVEMGISELLGVQRSRNKLASDLHQALHQNGIRAGAAAMASSFNHFGDVTAGLGLDFSRLTLITNGDRAKPPGKGRTIVTNKDKAYYDGQQWRKYGNKNIKGSGYSREYYRCTYSQNGCAASKQVQQLDSGTRPKYEVSYENQHSHHPNSEQGSVSKKPRHSSKNAESSNSTEISSILDGEGCWVNLLAYSDRLGPSDIIIPDDHY